MISRMRVERFSLSFSWSMKHRNPSLRDQRSRFLLNQWPWSN
jgi:hypothetical protein